MTKNTKSQITVQVSLIKTIRKFVAHEDEKKELESVAKNFVGVLKWNKKHPNWPNKKATDYWSKDIRSEWDR